MDQGALTCSIILPSTIKIYAPKEKMLTQARPTAQPPARRHSFILITRVFCWFKSKRQNLCLQTFNKKSFSLRNQGLKDEQVGQDVGGYYGPPNLELLCVH